METAEDICSVLGQRDDFLAESQENNQPFLHHDNASRDGFLSVEQDLDMIETGSSIDKNGADVFLREIVDREDSLVTGTDPLVTGTDPACPLQSVAVCVYEPDMKGSEYTVKASHPCQSIHTGAFSNTAAISDLHTNVQGSGILTSTDVSHRNVGCADRDRTDDKEEQTLCEPGFSDFVVAEVPDGSTDRASSVHCERNSCTEPSAQTDSPVINTVACPGITLEADNALSFSQCILSTSETVNSLTVSDTFDCIALASVMDSEQTPAMAVCNKEDDAVLATFTSVDPNRTSQGHSEISAELERSVTEHFTSHSCNETLHDTCAAMEDQLVHSGQSSFDCIALVSDINNVQSPAVALCNREENTVDTFTSVDPNRTSQGHPEISAEIERSITGHFTSHSGNETLSDTSAATEGQSVHSSQASFDCIAKVSGSNSLQTPAMAMYNREDPVLATVTSGDPDATVQGHPEVSAEIEGSITEQFTPRSCNEILQDTSVATEDQSAHSGQSSLSSFVSAQKESDPKVLHSDLSCVRIKEEPSDAGYEQAQTHNRQPISLSLNSIQGLPAVKAADLPSATTTIMKQGKRRVRITVIKGEWRKPKTKAQNKHVNNPVIQDTEQNAINQAQTSPSAKATDRTESASSAFPTGLFRNVHIKTEPEEGDYPDSQVNCEAQQTAISAPSSCSQQTLPVSSACTSSQQTLQSSSCTSSQQTVSRAPVMLTGTPTRSVHMSAISSSLFSGRTSRRRGRERGHISLRGSSSDSAAPDPVAPKQLKTALKKNEESALQFCAVKLKRLPSDIVAAGIVDLKTDPQVMKMVSPNDVKDGLQSSVRSNIKVFSPQALRSVQKRSKHGPRPWACERCDKTFKTASARSQHRKVHAGVKEHSCQFCGKAFVYKSTLTAHYRTHTDERPYVCSLCGAGFRWSNHLTNHLATHSEVKPFRCDQCGRSFTQKGNLMTHLKRHSGVRTHKCAECDTTCVTKTELASHMRKHTGEKPFKCSQCPASFAQSNTLLAHLRSHNDERPYQCHLCSSAFRQSSHRATHIRLLHEKSEEEGDRPKKKKRKVSYRGPKSMAYTRKTNPESAVQTGEPSRCDEAAPKADRPKVRSKAKKRRENGLQRE